MTPIKLRYKSIKPIKMPMKTIVNYEIDDDEQSVIKINDQ